MAILFLAIALIIDDFPTLLLPLKQNSVFPSAIQSLALNADLIK
jgi:hypothetical protein